MSAFSTLSSRLPPVARRRAATSSSGRRRSHSQLDLDMVSKSKTNDLSSPSSSSTGPLISRPLFRRSHLALDHRPLKSTIYERFSKFAGMTNIHGFLPLERIHEMGCFFRVIFLLMLTAGICCAFYFIREEANNFHQEVVELYHDHEQATASDLYFPQVAICNSNFIQASFLEEYGIANYSNLLIDYYFSGSYRRITGEEKKTIEKIENMTLGRRIAGSLMRFGNSTSIKTLLMQLENKTHDQLVDFAEENRLPTPLPLITGIKPGFNSVLRATYKSVNRDPNHMAPLFPSYRTDFGWCTVVIPMVEFDDRFNNENFQTLRERRSPNVEKGTMLGKQGGLRLLLDAEVYDYSYGAYGAEGFLIGVVPHRDIPLMFLDETQARPGSVTNIIIKPTLTKSAVVSNRTLKSHYHFTPITFALRTEPEVKARFDPDQRLCYFQDEIITDKDIGIGGDNRHRYSLSNCYWQASVSHATQVCGCKLWNYGALTRSLDFCTGENLTCFKESLHDFSKHTSFTDNNNKTHECYNDCESYTHTLSSNSGSYPNAETLLYNDQDYCAIVDKMQMSCKDELKAHKLNETVFKCKILQKEDSKEIVDSCLRFIYLDGFNTTVPNMTEMFRANDELRQAVWNYSSNNVALINLFFKEINVRRMVRKEAYTISGFVAAIGGLLGLAMGVSFVTFFEASYMVIRVITLVVSHWLAHCGNKHPTRDSHYEIKGGERKEISRIYLKELWEYLINARKA